MHGERRRVDALEERPAGDRRDGPVRQAAEEEWTVVLSHEPRQPVGRFVADRDRFRFLPAF